MGQYNVFDIYVKYTYVEHMHKKDRRRRRFSRSRHQGRDGSWVVEARVERFVEPAVLLTLDEGEAHGYELAESLASWLPDDRIDLGNLYRMLRALETEGLVRSEWQSEQSGRSKRTYRLTPEGQEVLKAWVAALENTRATVDRFVRRSQEGGKS